MHVCTAIKFVSSERLDAQTRDSGSSQEESQKRQRTVNWEDQSDCKTEEHELMIDSGCFGHVHPPWFAPQFPMVSSTNVKAVAANNVALQCHLQLPHHFSKPDSEFDISRLSFLPTHLWKESCLVMAGENATNDVGSLRQRWCRET